MQLAQQKHNARQELQGHVVILMEINLAARLNFNALGAKQIVTEVTLYQAIAQEITMLMMALAQSYKLRQQFNAQARRTLAQLTTLIQDSVLFKGALLFQTLVVVLATNQPATTTLLVAGLIIRRIVQHIITIVIHAQILQVAHLTSVRVMGTNHRALVLMRLAVGV
jgi:hypothetical protein